MCKIMGFDTDEFDSHIVMNERIESDRLYELVSKELEKIPREDQYKAMAWVS